MCNISRLETDVAQNGSRRGLHIAVRGKSTVLAKKADEASTHPVGYWGGMNKVRRGKK